MYRRNISQGPLFYFLNATFLLILQVFYSMYTNRQTPKYSIFSYLLVLVKITANFKEITKLCTVKVFVGCLKKPPQDPQLDMDSHVTLCFTPVHPAVFSCQGTAFNILPIKLQYIS